MENNCDACEILKNPVEKTQILNTNYWSVNVDSSNHAYLGRAYVTLNEHKASLSSLGSDEWEDFQTIVKTLERA